MSRRSIIFIVLVILLLGLLPVWPYGPALGFGWYGPGVILLALVIFLLLQL